MRVDILCIVGCHSYAAVGNALSEYRAVDLLAVPIVRNAVEIVVFVVSRCIFAADCTCKEFLLLALDRMLAFLGRGAFFADSYIDKSYEFPVSFGSLEDSCKEVACVTEDKPVCFAAHTLGLFSHGLFNVIGSHGSGVSLTL